MAQAWHPGMIGKPKTPTALGALDSALSMVDKVDKLESVGKKIAQVGDSILTAHKVKRDIEADPGGNLPGVRMFLLIGLAFLGGFLAREIFTRASVKNE